MLEKKTQFQPLERIVQNQPTWNNKHSVKFLIIVTVGSILGFPPTTNVLFRLCVRARTHLCAYAWGNHDRKWDRLLTSEKFKNKKRSFYLPLSGSSALFFFCSNVAGKNKNSIIVWYRTCALPPSRWQMDYKNFKGEHLEHQGRDGRYLNYHSLPRRQRLPDMAYTSRNSATTQT